jgi:ABC-type Zn uptake system ZnuABC Zn-binding protein ZnuA
MEPFYDRKVAESVAKHTGVKVLILPPSVGGVPNVSDYFQLVRYDVTQLAAAVK